SFSRDWSSDVCSSDLYDIENSQLPITIPSGCIVSGVGGGNPELGGRGTIILCNNALAVFIVDSLAELRDLGIGLLYTPFAFLTGIGVVELFNLATSRNVRVYTFGVSVGDNTDIQGVFVGTGEVSILDCEVDCEFQNTLIAGGIPALRLTQANNSECRLVVRRCDQMLWWDQGANCKVS